jgi:hypothetical protein
MISDWIFLFTSFLGENKTDNKILNMSYNNQADLENSCESMHVWSLCCVVIQRTEAKDTDLGSNDNNTATTLCKTVHQFYQ